MAERRRALVVAGALAALAGGCVPLQEVAAATGGPIARAAPGGAPIDVAGARLTVSFVGAAGKTPDAAYLAWVKRSALVVERYCGRFPVPGFTITLHRGAGDDIGYGQHQGGRFIDVWIGRDVDEAALDDDWVMIHEMLHAAMPELPEGHRWMQEGLSTFAEPIARAEAGRLPPARVWSNWIDMMPKGRPGFYDGGLDQTDTWARRYWGGALFWLVADVRIRRATGGKKSVRDCVRGFLARGGNSRVEWPPKKVAAVCDEVTGTDVMKALYSSLAEAPGDVDTDELFASLGVRDDGDGGVRFDDRAPLASLRAAMTAP